MVVQQCLNCVHTVHNAIQGLYKHKEVIDMKPSINNDIKIVYN